jgi:hypothetical protein
MSKVRLYTIAVGDHSFQHCHWTSILASLTFEFKTAAIVIIPGNPVRCRFSPLENAALVVACGNFVRIFLSFLKV